MYTQSCKGVPTKKQSLTVSLDVFGDFIVTERGYICITIC